MGGVDLFGHTPWVGHDLLGHNPGVGHDLLGHAPGVGHDLPGHTPGVGWTFLVVLHGRSGACALSLDFSQQVLCEKF